ncbi:MAG: iduronate-2-sulfatase [Pirellula sp.]|nr:iduronate-2-sulfatase [Pirellula sp.]
MNGHFVRIASLVVCLGGVASASASAAEPSKVNVVMIVLDDQNSFALKRDLAKEPASPNLAKLAQRGLTFAHAQCAAPVCNPSRSAIFSGLRPSTSGVYDNDQGRLSPGNALERATSLPGYFHDRGYLTAGAGKLFAASFGSTVGKEVWDVTEGAATRRNGHGPRPPKESLPLNGVGKHDWGAFPESKEDTEDWQLAGWAAEFLAKSHDKPFFLACGIVKPHTPWYVPQEYFDLFSADEIKITDLAADESAGLPKAAREKRHRGDDELIKRRKELIAAYLAASRYADDCVGRILNALEASPHRDNTVVVVCGDHGYHFGEKNHWSKGTLWEESAQTPLVVAGPGVVSGKLCTHPVSLVDIYPTLLELAHLPPNPNVDGVSIAPLCRDPSVAWERPALTTAGYQNHALRNDRWRYIRYADGSEELYDHDQDPLERTNLADRPESVAVIAELRQWLPTEDAIRAKPLSKGDD